MRGGDMSGNNLYITPSPHIFAREDIRGIMWRTVASLVPPLVAGIYFFGLRALLLTVVTVATALLTEYLFLLLRKKDTSAVFDGSAVITGILLALILPPRFPLYAAAIGSFFAIAFGKQIFGGLGNNIFNPALLGRAFLMAAFPVESTVYSPPIRSIFGLDVITQATPLTAMKFSHIKTPYINLLIGNTGGSMGETSALLIILGGLYLIYKKYIDWRLPLSYIGTVFLLGGVFWLINPQKYPDPLFHILAGGLMLGAFYMITDMVTSPVTPKGRVIYGIGAGIFVIIIRLFGGYPEGVMFSILLMNSVRPWIDRLIVPKRFGEVRK